MSKYDYMVLHAWNLPTTPTAIATVTFAFAVVPFAKKKILWEMPLTRGKIVVPLQERSSRRGLLGKQVTVYLVMWKFGILFHKSHENSREVQYTK